jgi:hypothetical protein
MNVPILHIYQPASHHDDAYIFGNRDGLEALKRQIEAALAGQPSDEEDHFQNDGEGYSVVVRVASEAWVNLLPCAYTEWPDHGDDGQKAFQAVASGFAGASQ